MVSVLKITSNLNQKVTVIYVLWDFRFLDWLWAVRCIGLVRGALADQNLHLIYSTPYNDIIILQITIIANSPTVPHNLLIVDNSVTIYQPLVIVIREL